MVIASKKQFTWTSSNENVATVINGKVTAKEAGTTTIKARSKANSSAEATCKVTVKLPDGDNDGIPDKYDKEPDSIAILTIFSVPSGEYNSTGHSFLTLKNITNKDLIFHCITIPPGEELSFGTWDGDERDGIFYNYEAKELKNKEYKYTGRVSLSVPIGIEQYNKILVYVTNNDDWCLLLNCSSFARGLWNSVVASISPLSPTPLTDFPLSAGVANSPDGLAESIKQYENEKLYGYKKIYDENAKVKFSEKFTNNYLGYIENGNFITLLIS